MVHSVNGLWLCGFQDCGDSLSIAPPRLHLRELVHQAVIGP